MEQFIVWLRRDETDVEGKPRPVPRSLDRHGIRCADFIDLVKNDPFKAEKVLRRAHGRFISSAPEHDTLQQRAVVVLDAPAGEVSWQLVRQVREVFREERTKRVRKITVTVDAMVFDGDELSQTRMTRAIVVMDDVETLPWTLADNTSVLITKDQLKRALRAAGEAQTAIWVLPGE